MSISYFCFRKLWLFAFQYPPQYHFLGDEFPPFLYILGLTTSFCVCLVGGFCFILVLCWLCWAFLAALRLFVENQTFSSCSEQAALEHVGSVVAVHGVSNWGVQLRCPVTRGILVPWPGIESAPPAVEGRFLTTGPPGKSLTISLMPQKPVITWQITVDVGGLSSSVQAAITHYYGLESL